VPLRSDSRSRTLCHRRIETFALIEGWRSRMADVLEVPAAIADRCATRAGWAGSPSTASCASRASAAWHRVAERNREGGDGVEGMVASREAPVRRLVPLLLVLLASAPVADAQELPVEVCGAGGCVTVSDPVLAGFLNSTGAPRAAPDAEPFYVVRRRRVQDVVAKSQRSARDDPGFGVPQGPP
jgi:hypothetical protein